MKDNQEKTRVLVVDDSAFARLMITRHLAQDNALEVAGVATRWH